MISYKQFVFESYEFEEKSGTLNLHYGMDDMLHFTETYSFDFEFTSYDPAVLDRALQLLFFVAGVSYFKTYLPPEISIRQGETDQTLTNFLSKTYQKGLGEFWYVNQLDPNTPVQFPVTTRGENLNTLTHNGQGLLVGMGGGKDSLVSVEILRNQGTNIATWSLNHRPQLTPLIDRIGLPHYWVERQWDKQLLALNAKDALNGHVPISAIIAATGAVAAVLSGRQDIVVSNEQSANEPTLTYRDVTINHQYSKSQEFEQGFQDYLRHAFGDSLRYYSLLRPFSELRITELFAEYGFEKYKDVFSSCNRAFVHTSNQMSWCGECSKCAFVFLMLTPFLPPESVEKIWGGKNLLRDPLLVPVYRRILGIEGDKPLDCVGEVKESRAAIRLAQAVYPDLSKYRFELPESYDFRSVGNHAMPDEMYELVLNAVRRG